MYIDLILNNITSLSELGKAQLSTDIGYICNIVIYIYIEIYIFYINFFLFLLDNST